MARVAHSIKGSASTFGARRVARLALELEGESLSDHPDHAILSQFVSCLESEFEAFRLILGLRREYATSRA